MKVTSTVKMNFPRIKQLTQAAVIALEQTAENLHTEIVQSQVVPRDTGALQGEKGFFVDYSETQNGKVSLVHEGPYARRLYYHPEYNFRMDENPNAKGHWFEDWEAGGRKAEFAPKVFKQMYKKVGGV